MLKRAAEAKEKSETEGTKEQVQLQVLGSFEEGASLNLKTLKTNLESIGAKVIADDFPVTAILNHKSYKIDAGGNVEMQENADRNGINVGDYINFEPDADQDAEGNPVQKTYSKEYLTEEYTGDLTDPKKRMNTVDLTQDPIKWRILKKYEDGSIKIVGDVTSKSFRFWDATGYNNAVWILNDICEQLYSKKSVGIKARSISLEDFEDDDYYVSATQGNWRVARDNYISEKIATLKNELDELEDGSNYIEAVNIQNNTVTYKKAYSHYTNLYAYENGSGIDTINIKTNGISQNDKFAKSREELDKTIGHNATKQANNYLTVTQTQYDIPINEANYGEAYNVLKGSAFWLASRAVQCDSNIAEFGLYKIMNNSMQFVKSISSDLNTRTQTQAKVRPVVILGPNVKITPSETASSADGTPHQITKY